MSLVYKTLFEVKLMHEYFLTRKDGNSIFEKPTQQERLDFLAEEYTSENESINSDLSFDFPDSLKEQYKGLFLKIIPTYSGFRVAARVQPKVLPDQSLVYSPYVALPADLVILIVFSRKNNAIDSYTNTSLSNAVPGTYFFSNAGQHIFPFLANDIPAFDPTLQYEQGELTMGPGGIQQFSNDGSNDPWDPVAGAGFVNESDKILLPGAFRYQFPDITGMTEAVFKLKDTNSNTVSTITETNAGGLKKYLPLNFNSYSGTGSIHTLEVNANNGYSRIHRLYLDNELTRSNPWAVLEIQNDIANTAFNFLATDGNLVLRRDNLGQLTPAPVFEIPIKSRYVFWRFINYRESEINISADLNGYVNKENNFLITKRPVPLTKSYFLLRKEGTNDTVYVPNPETNEIKIESGKRICLNVRVPDSELFPVAP